MGCRAVSARHGNRRKTITVCDAPLKKRIDPNLEGLYIDIFNLALIDERPKRPKTYVLIHELLHGLYPEKSEVEILKLADEEYKNYTGKDIDTYGDFLRAVGNKMEVHGLSEQKNPEELEKTIREIGQDRRASFDEYKRDEEIYQKYFNNFNELNLEKMK